MVGDVSIDRYSSGIDANAALPFRSSTFASIASFGSSEIAVV